MEQAKELLLQYLELKAQEEELRSERRVIATKLMALLPHPEEGTKTHTIDEYKITLNQRMNRKVDWNKFDAVMRRFPGKHAPERLKRELDVPSLKWVRQNQPELYMALSDAIIATPGLPSITVKDSQNE